MENLGKKHVLQCVLHGVLQGLAAPDTPRLRKVSPRTEDGSPRVLGRRSICLSRYHGHSPSPPPYPLSDSMLNVASAEHGAMLRPGGSALCSSPFRPSAPHRSTLGNEGRGEGRAGDVSVRASEGHVVMMIENIPDIMVL